MRTRRLGLVEGSSAMAPLSTDTSGVEAKPSSRFEPLLRFSSADREKERGQHRSPAVREARSSRPNRPLDHQGQESKKEGQAGRMVWSLSFGRTRMSPTTEQLLAS